MNDARRKKLAEAKAKIAALEEQRDTLASAITEAREEIEGLRDEEQEYLDAMPESFQNGEKGEKANAAIEAMDEAMQRLEDIAADVENLDFSDATSSLETAAE